MRDKRTKKSLIPIIIALLCLTFFVGCVVSENNGNGFGQRPEFAVNPPQTREEAISVIENEDGWGISPGTWVGGTTSVIAARYSRNGVAVDWTFAGVSIEIGATYFVERIDFWFIDTHTLSDCFDPRTFDREEVINYSFVVYGNTRVFWRTFYYLHEPGGD